MREDFRKQLERTHQNLQEGMEPKDPIAVLQQKKAKEMLRLKEQIKEVERNERTEHGLPYSWRTKMNPDGTFIARYQDKEVSITLGDMLTDMSWGIGYDLDPETVPYPVRKEYVIELAKWRIRQLLDRQILHDESSRETESQQTFLAIQRRFEEGEWDLGHVAETMIKNYLKKLSIDRRLPVEVVDVDLFEDVIDKIDFILQVKNGHRGVDVEVEVEEEIGDNVAVQFTLKERKQQVLNKRKILQDRLFGQGAEGEVRIDDAVVLFLHERYVRRALKHWREQFNQDDSNFPMPGGPESHLENRGQVEVLHRLFDDLLGESEVESICEDLGLERLSKPVKKY